MIIRQVFMILLLFYSSKKKNQKNIGYQMSISLSLNCWIFKIFLLETMETLVSSSLSQYQSDVEGKYDRPSAEK